MNHYPKLPVSIFRLSPVSVAHGAEGFEDFGDVGGLARVGPKRLERWSVERVARQRFAVARQERGAWESGGRRRHCV